MRCGLCLNPMRRATGHVTLSSDAGMESSYSHPSIRKEICVHCRDDIEWFLTSLTPGGRNEPIRSH